MGVSKKEYEFLKYSSSIKKFGKVLTIGRQQLFLKKFINKKEYCEEIFLDEFNANSIDSIDNSNYENATIIADLNNEIDSDRYPKFDTIYDGGALEHIYNVPQALKNMSSLLKSDGQIIHAVPANNQCGHGFYQFSPELFYSVYSNKNGYSTCEVYIAISNGKNIYKVKRPEENIRNSLRTISDAILLVRAVRNNEKFSHENIQQSDYLYHWNNKLNEENKNNKIKIIYRIKKKLNGWPIFYKIAYQAYHLYYRNIASWVSVLNPMLKKIKLNKNK